MSTNFVNIDSITITNNSLTVTVNSAEDITAFKDGDLIFTESNLPLIISSISGSTITLRTNALFSLTAGDATIISGQVKLAEALGTIEENNQIWADNFGRFIYWLTTDDATAELLDASGTPRQVKTAKGLEATLGTAGVLDVQSSLYDTTVGDLMSVGAFGLGDTDTPEAADCNDIDYTAFHRCTSSTLNTPFSGVATLITVQGLVDTYASQIFVTGTNRFFFRSKTSNVWQDWNESFHTGNSVNPTDYGFGTSTVSFPNDLDAVVDSSVVGVSASTTTGAPSDDDATVPDIGAVITIPRSSTDAGQIGVFNGSDPHLVYRYKRNGVWTDWVRSFDTGNDINSLEHGLGETLTPALSVLADNTLQPTAFIKDGDGSIFGSVSSVINMRYNSTKQAQIGISNAGDDSLQFRTMSSASTWGPLREVYHSGNSINPLDYGIGSSNLANYTGDVDDLTATGNYIVNGGSINQPEAGAAYYLIVTGADGTGFTSQIAQKKTSGVAELWHRTSNSGTWTEWSQVYHSGNSVNPLDYGIGGLSAQDTDFDNLTAGGKYYVNVADGASVNAPVNNGNKNWVVDVTAWSNTTNTFQLATRVSVSGTSNYEQYYRVQASGTWHDWVEVYHSGNSVNPLDYGIGGEAISVSNFDTITKSGFYRNSNASAVGIPPVSSSVYHLTHIERDSSIAMQTAVQSSIGRLWIRGRSLGAWSDWEESYSTVNTNFNVFGGVTSSDVIGWGYALNSTTASIWLPLNSKTLPTGITSGPGTFVLLLSNGTVFRSAIPATDIQYSTSNDGAKIALVTVVNCAGLTAKEPVYLRAETSDSKITVNF